MKVNRYVYDEEKDVLELMDDGDYLEEVDLFSIDDEDDGYNSKTGEYYWSDMSYYRIPLKTNHFEYEDVLEESQEEVF